MKFVIYKDQRKFTVDNVDLSDNEDYRYLTQLPEQYVVHMSEEDLGKLRITSTRSLFENQEDYNGEETPLFGDIDLQLETVN